MPTFTWFPSSQEKKKRKEKKENYTCCGYWKL